MTNFQARRQALGMRREDLAALSGASLSTIVRAENGKRISPLALHAIERALADAEAQRKGVA